MPELDIENLSNQLIPGDVLIIVPPIAKVDLPSLAAHLLQAECRHIGISIKILYANLFFSSLIGFDLYHTITDFNSINFIGERLFARAAFDLPPMGRNIHRLIDPGWLPDHLWQKRNETAARKMSVHLAPIRRWLLSIDWRHVEEQAARWVTATAKHIAGRGYRIVGCTNTLGGLAPAIALLYHIKQTNPDIITVLGGAHCEGEMAEGILSLNRGIDYVFSGESDDTFPVFVRDILSGQRPKEKIIRGREIKNLDDIPLPDYREFFRQAENTGLKNPPGNSFPVLYETSRGCRWKKCTFCGITGERKSQHVKSQEKVLDDLEQLASRYPASPVHMADTLMPVQYCKTLFPRIAQKFPSMRIRYEVNAKLTLDQVITLKEAGINRILPGIESLSPSLLKRMRKGVTLRENIALLRYGRSVGIDLTWHLLVGFPGDQVNEYEEILEIFPLLHHLQPPDMIPPIKICRFSINQKEPAAFGISNLRPAALYEDILPAHADVEKIAYFFAGDFKSQCYEHPDILARLRREFQVWVNLWEPFNGDPLNPKLPKLHLERNIKNPGDFVLHDTRGLQGIPKTTVVDKEKVKILLSARPWDDCLQMRWAVEAGLAIVKDSWFIPLVTAEPTLLQEFERDWHRKPGIKNKLM